jgi:putative DNA-invertase from lambdoid prophage Rac
MPVKWASRQAESGRVFGQRRKPPKMFRAALYARVSTFDQQSIPLQIRALREYAARRGWTIALQVKEVGSGAAQREQREKLLDAARRREIDVVLVWRLDRWGRSVADLLATLQELDHLGVGFVSLTEALDLTTPAGRAMAALLAVFADNAEHAIMQSHSAEVAVWRALPWRGTPHNPPPTSARCPTMNLENIALLDARFPWLRGAEKRLI